MKKISVFMVDDHQIVRDGIFALLIKEEKIEITGDAGHAEELFGLLTKTIPDVIIMDISMPGMSGIEITEKLSIDYPEIKVIIFSTHTDENRIFDSIKAGARGYLPKDVVRDELVKAIFTVVEGEEYLSDSISNTILIKYIKKETGQDKYSAEKTNVLSARELEILKYVAEGLAYKEIGEKLFISPRTVETHKNNIMQKLRLRSTIELVKFAIKNGIIEI